MSDVIEYRLSWESINSIQAAAYDDTYGRGIWRRLSETEWENLQWQEPTVVVFTGGDRFDQHNTLKAWAESHEQPIRNVRLEQRPLPGPDAGWVEARTFKRHDERLPEAEGFA